MDGPPQTEAPARPARSARARLGVRGRLRRPPAGSRAGLLVAVGYLAAALALTGRLWAHPSALEQAGNRHDIDLFTWFIGYEADALAHGGLPALVTTALNAPRGVNLMWNTSLLLPGVVLSPVTWLAGPLATLTTVLTLGFAGSAAALYWVLRRWGASVPAAALGGAVYGFSPALLAAAMGHYHLQFAVLPPLIVDAALRIAAGRGRPLGNGVYLGAVVSAQVFTGEELLALTIVAAVFMVALLAAARPAAAPARAPGAALALAGAAVVVAAVCGHALWVQFAGPLQQYGSPWRTWFYHAYPSGFVTPPGSLLLHTAASAAAAVRYPEGPPEYLAYLGWPLLIALVAAVVRYWRNPAVRLAGLTWALLELFSLGSVGVTVAGLRYPQAGMPWFWLDKLPMLGQILPARFAILADGAAAAALAFAFDLVRSDLAGLTAARAARWARPTARAGLAAAAAAAVLPLVPLPLQPLPVPGAPPGWQAVFSRLHLPAGARTLLIPVGAPAMRWQADTRQPISLIGGWCLAPSRHGHAAPCATGKRRTAWYFDALWRKQTPPRVPPRAVIAADIAYWRPEAVVAAAPPGSALGRELTAVFGPPTAASGEVTGWRLALTTRSNPEDAVMPW